MRVVVAGAGGQLGRELQVTCPANVDLIALDRTRLDITRVDRVHQALGEARAEVVINAAAYTAVDRAEKDREQAFFVNAEGPRILAVVAHEIGARLIHVSTDFVFSGDQSHPHLPAAKTEPRSIYGESKLAGENHVLQIAGIHGLIVRTAWVYSRFGANFVKTILRLMSERDEVSVVMDQIGTPTWARSLAETVWAALGHPDLHGVVHWTDNGVASWYDLAIAIQEEATALGLLRSSCQVLPVTTADYPTAAHRPAYSVLDTTTIRHALGREGAHWRRQLRAMLLELRENGEE